MFIRLEEKWDYYKNCPKDDSFCGVKCVNMLLMSNVNILLFIKNPLKTLVIQLRIDEKHWLDKSINTSLKLDMNQELVAILAP